MTWLRDIDRWLIEAVLPHRAELKKHAARVVGADDADDLVQDAFARLLSYAHWREIANPRAFCLTIVRNLAIEKLRRARVVRLDAMAAVDVGDDTPDAFRQTAARIELERLLAWIDELPPQCARVLRLRKIDGHAPRDIAVLLGITVSTVETHLAKGLARLTLRMREHEAKGGDWPTVWAKRTGKS